MIPVRVVVVGSGVIGLLTAMECVRAGARVDLVDQAGIPSLLATSYDQVRVIRALHRGDPTLTAAAARADACWRAIERRLAARFYHRVGVLTAMAAEDVGGYLRPLAESGIPVRVLTVADLSARYPAVRFQPGQEAIFEPAAGGVMAARALRAIAHWLGEQPGVRLYPQHRVLEVTEAGAVRLANGTVLSGESVVIAAGPWSRDLLPIELTAGLMLHRQSMLWYLPAGSRGAWAGAPAMLGLGHAGDAWLMPSAAGPAIGLSASSACRAVQEISGRDADEKWRNQLIGQFSAVLVDFCPAAVVRAADGYYLAAAPGGGPLLAALGGRPVWAYAACGGMSFKFAPLVARALADRATQRPPRVTGLEAVDRPRQVAVT